MIGLASPRFEDFDTPVLSLSTRTVETYLARVFSKFNASCRAEVAGKVAPLMRTSAS